MDSGFRILGTIFQITQCGGSTGGARGGGGGPGGGAGGGGGGAHVNKATRDALLMVANIFIYASLFGGNITGRRQIFG